MKTKKEGDFVQAERNHERGWVEVFTMFFMMLFILLFFVAFERYWIYDTQQRLQMALDSATNGYISAYEFDEFGTRTLNTQAAKNRFCEQLHFNLVAQVQANGKTPDTAERFCIKESDYETTKNWRWHDTNTVEIHNSTCSAQENKMTICKLSEFSIVVHIPFRYQSSFISGFEQTTLWISSRNGLR